MRIMILAAASAITIAFATFNTTPAQAVGVRYPFCMQGNRNPGLSSCVYQTYEQCQATASGLGQNCIANPYYVGDSDPRSYLHSPRTRRDDGNIFELFFH